MEIATIVVNLDIGHLIAESPRRRIREITGIKEAEVSPRLAEERVEVPPLGQEAEEKEIIAREKPEGIRECVMTVVLRVISEERPSAGAVGRV